jgi:hypothetical protein
MIRLQKIHGRAIIGRHVGEADLAAGKAFGFGILGAVVGAVAGGVIGLGGGLLWTTLAGTSGFEGYAGVVTAMWMLAGIIAGLIAGAVFGARKGLRSPI